MAMEPKTKKIILISVGIIALLGLAYLIYKLAQPADVAPPTPDGTTTTEKPGLLDTATAFFCKTFPNSKLCGGAGKKPVNCISGCDSNRAGYDCNGFPDSNCGFGRVQG